MGIFKIDTFIGNFSIVILGVVYMFMKKPLSDMEYIIFIVLNFINIGVLYKTIQEMRDIGR